MTLVGMRRARRWSWVGLALSSTVSLSAVAEPLVGAAGPTALPAGSDPPLTTPLEVPAGRSLSTRIAERMNVLGDELGTHLSTVTADLVRLEFDFVRREGRFRLGGGDGDSVKLQLDGDVEVNAAGTARVHSRLGLGLAGGSLSLPLPPVDLVTRTVAGERVYELRLPVFEGHF